MRTTTATIGNYVGASKTFRERKKSIVECPTVVNVWKESYATGLINFHDDTNESIELRDDLEVETDRFYWRYNIQLGRRTMFFERQYLRINRFTKMVKSSSVKEAIGGTSTKNCSIMHGLRGTLALLPFVSELSNS